VAAAQNDEKTGQNPPASSSAPEGIEAWFAKFESSQQEAFRTNVTKPFEAGLADLRARYLASLDAAVAKASAAGQLEEALAYRTERSAFERAQQVTSNDGTAPTSVKTLRAAFRQQITKLEQERATKAAALFATSAIIRKYDTATRSL